MWNIFSKEARELMRDVTPIKNLIIKSVPKDQLISLYFGGKHHHEIELYGFVNDTFEMKTEDEINKALRKLFAVFHALYLSDFEGTKTGSNRMTKDERSVRLLIRRMPHYQCLWGTLINFSRLPFKELTAEEEILKQIEHVEEDIMFAKEHSFNWPEGEKHRFLTFVKEVYHVARLETVVLKGNKYHMSFSKALEQLKDDTEHISHACEKIRRLGEYTEEPHAQSLRERFVTHSERYVNEIKEKVTRPKAPSRHGHARSQ